MSKFFKILAFYSLLLVYIQSLNSLEEENPFNPTKMQFKSNESKNDFEEIEIKVNSTYHQNMIVGYNGTFVFTAEYNDKLLNIFEPETLEQ